MGEKLLYRTHLRVCRARNTSDFARAAPRRRRSRAQRARHDAAAARGSVRRRGRGRAGLSDGDRGAGVQLPPIQRLPRGAPHPPPRFDARTRRRRAKISNPARRDRSSDRSVASPPPRLPPSTPHRSPRPSPHRIRTPSRVIAPIVIVAQTLTLFKEEARPLLAPFKNRVPNGVKALDEVRSISHRSPYAPVRVVNAVS